MPLKQATKGIQVEDKALWAESFKVAKRGFILRLV